MNKVIRIFLLGTICIITMGCGSAGIQSSNNGAFMQSIIGQKFGLAGYPSSRLWEGRIEGKQVTYFRSLGLNALNNIVVVTQDDLPGYFRSIAYYDHDGDRNLDLIDIRQYREGEGWNDLRITAKNANTLQHANIKYNELLNKIIDLRLKEVDYE